jgi:hypothetical protein
MFLDRLTFFYFPSSGHSLKKKESKRLCVICISPCHEHVIQRYSFVRPSFEHHGGWACSYLTDHSQLYLAFSDGLVLLICVSLDVMPVLYWYPSFVSILYIFVCNPVRSVKFEKAFDRVGRVILWFILQDLAMLCDQIRGMHDNTHLCTDIGKRTE